MSLRILQYAYFSVDSPTVTASQMTERLGLAPDKVRVRGSLVSDPPRPDTHSWQLVEDRLDSGDDLHQQIERLMARVGSVAPALTQLLTEIAVADTPPVLGCRLQVVRYLNDPAGQLDGFQHQQLGWGLSASTVQLLARLGAFLDVDEYGSDISRWRPIARHKYSWPFADPWWRRPWRDADTTPRPVPGSAEWKAGHAQALSGLLDDPPLEGLDRATLRQQQIDHNAGYIVGLNETQRRRWAVVNRDGSKEMPGPG